MPTRSITDFPRRASETQTQVDAQRVRLRSPRLFSRNWRNGLNGCWLSVRAPARGLVVGSLLRPWVYRVPLARAPCLSDLIRKQATSVFAFSVDGLMGKVNPATSV